MEKAFPTADVLGVLTGRLLHADIGGIYQVLNFMTGESVYTHQIPRCGAEAAPVILAAHPELAVVMDKAEILSAENVADWLATWIGRYGETITVPRMTPDQHERIDPVSDLAEKIHPDRVITLER